MKNLSISILFGAIVVVAAACGGGGNNNSTPACQAGTSWNGSSCVLSYNGLNSPFGNTCQGSCQVGSVMAIVPGNSTPQCLPQGTCSPCMASYNGSCIPASAVPGYNNGTYAGGYSGGYSGGYYGGGYSGGYGTSGGGYYGYPGYGGGYYYYPVYYPMYPSYGYGAGFHAGASIGF